MTNMLDHFVGTHEHSLDVKGRITLPARLRSSIGDSCVVARSKYGDRCISVWRDSEFRQYSEELLANDLVDIDRSRSARIWSSEAFAAEIDSNGRLALPLRLRSYAQLERDVLIIGAIDTIEIWSPENWNAFRGVDDV